MKKFWQIVGVLMLIGVIGSAIAGSNKTSGTTTSLPNVSTTDTSGTSTDTSAAPNATVDTSPTTTAAPSSNLTIPQQNAVQAAHDYLSTTAFSKQGLTNQLSSSSGDGYSVQDAMFAVDGLNVDWNAQAVKAAKDYLQTSSFSCQGMTDQLSSSSGDNYTAGQAQFAATKVGLC